MSSGAFLEGADVAALYELADLLDDVGVCEGGDFASEWNWFSSANHALTG